MYRLGASPQELGLMTSISMTGMVLGHFFTPHLQRYYKDSNLVYAFSQKAVLWICVLLMLYTALGMYGNNWGNFWIWTIISTLSSFCISVEQASRPLFVKNSFPDINYSHIMRQDVLTMGVAKVLGFASGILIVSHLWVLFIFLIGALISYAMLFYANKMIKSSSVIERLKAIKEPVSILSYKTTIAIHMLTYLLLFPINTQAVTYSKIWNVPFYWFFIAGSLGNVFFNLFLNKTVGLELRKAFVVYTFCLLAGFGLFLTASGYEVLAGSFLVGGAYASFNALSSSRVYEGGFAAHYISRFYVAGSVICIAGSYLLGLGLEHMSKNSVFTILFCLSLLYFVIYIYDNKKFILSKKQHLNS